MSKRTYKEKLDHFLRCASTDDEQIYKLAQQVLPESWLDGNKYTVPAIVTIVEKLVEIIKKYENKKES